MAFEIIFSYKTKGSSDVLQSFKKIVGTPESDTPLELAYSEILKNLARRDRIVENVEIFEFVKKKVKFKECKGGFIIKDRKFLFDDEPVISSSPSAATYEPEVPIQSSVKVPTELPAFHPQKYEVYDANPMQDAIVKNKKYKLTIGKKYPIFKEWHSGGKEDGITMYVLKDDIGREIQLSGDHFSAVRSAGLIGDFNDVRPKEPTLSYAGQYIEDNPISFRQANVKPDISSREDYMPDLTQLRR